MNKLVLLLIGGVVVVAGGFVIWMDDGGDKVNVSDDSGNTQEIATGDNALVAVDACDVLTESVAKKILGEGATKADLPAAGAASNDKVSVSNCNYTVEIEPGAIKPNNTNGLGVLVRAAKAQSEADNNKSIFTSNKPSGTQDVDGLGDKAFFNPAVYQLNVLKGGNWYILTNYSGSTSNSTLESTKLLAEALSFQ